MRGFQPYSRLLTTLAALLMAAGCSGQSNQPAVKINLDLPDKQIAEQAAALIERAGKVMSEGKDADAKAEQAAKSILSGNSSNLEKTAKEIAVLQNHDRRLEETAEALLQQAADLAMSCGPQWRGYRARAHIVAAFRESYPQYSVYLKPETCLSMPTAAPKCPPCGERYIHLLSIKGEYWTDPVYTGLTALSSAELPEDAMIVLCSLEKHNTTSLLRGDENGVPAGEIIAKYGPRFLPAALEYLCNPDKYGWKAEIARNAAGTKWFHPPVGHNLFRSAGMWPGDEAEMLFRAALEAGWNDASRYLPDQNWARELYAEFQSSPYGPPSTPRWVR